MQTPDVASKLLLEENERLRLSLKYMQKKLEDTKKNAHDQHLVALQFQRQNVRTCAFTLFKTVLSSSVDLFNLSSSF